MVKALGISFLICISLSAEGTEEAKAFAEQMLQKQVSPLNQQDLPCPSGNDPGLSNLQSVFSDNMDKGHKNADPIKQQLQQKAQIIEQKPNQPSLTEMETLLKQKHRWHVNADDPLFSQDKKIAQEVLINPQQDMLSGERKIETERLVTCREAAAGKEEFCVKRLTVVAIPQDPIVKTVTASFTAQCFNAATFSIDLKSGNISVSNCHNPGPKNLSIVNPIGTVDYPQNTTTKLLSKQWIGEKHVQFSASMAPSAANDFVLSFTATQPKTKHKKNRKYRDKVRGGTYVWEFTIPRKPRLEYRWEGCEIQENQSLDRSCRLVQSEQQGINEARSIDNYPDLITQPFWSEDRIYHCGLGSKANECEALKTEGCEQIESRCAVEKGEHCIEYEQTFVCRPHAYQKGAGLDLEGSVVTLKESNEDPGSYAASEFGDALTQFSILKEMNNEMKDGLGGLRGNPDNPSVFHGQCQRCTIKLGSHFQDCCKLKGIFRGCRESEKKLATAAVKDKRCHKVQGKYCTKKVLGVCVEQKEAYCCYGSQMAKIIQEIAHQQLNLPWGTGEEPNCGSLTAEQLSRLDFNTPFSTQQLSGLIGEYQATAQDKFNRVQGAVSVVGDMKARAKALQQNLERHFSKDKLTKEGAKP